MSKKLTVGLICGGVSPEHEVSFNSARNIYKAINRKKYRVEVIGISRKGQWQHLPEKAFMKVKSLDKKLGRALALMPGQSNPIVHKSGKNTFPKIDVIFPIVHGPFGEDGTLQGLLSILNLPFVGPNTLGAAVGMDKDFTKRILKEGGVNVSPGAVLYHHEKPNYKSLIKKFGLPLFVKPANMGSSVGVSKADNEKELKVAIEAAFQFDYKILVEQAIVGREIETAVLGNLEDVKASGIGEIVMEKGFYDYESKYISPDAAKVVIPAKGVSKKDINNIRKTAIKAYQLLGLEGLSRVDVFLTPSGEIYVNEPNTLPGFTNISMYPKLWEAAGVSYSDLIDELLQLGVRRFERSAKLQKVK